MKGFLKSKQESSQNVIGYFWYNLIGRYDNMIKNKKILILGMARSGIAAARLLSKFDNKIILTDNKEQNKEEIEELNRLGINCIVTNNQLDLLDAKLEIKSLKSIN